MSWPSPSPEYSVAATETNRRCGRFARTVHRSGIWCSICRSRPVISPFGWTRSRYDFDRANKSEYLLEGWGRPETSADGELTFAWATSRRASVKLGVRDTASYWLHVRSRAAAAAPDVGQTASITLNGHAIGSTAVEPGGFRVHSFAVPDDALISGDNVVAFSFTYAEASADPLARDPRSLAAAFDYVALTQRPEPPPISGRMERETSLPATTGAIRQVTGTESAFRVRVPEQGVLDFGVEKGQSEKVDAASPLHAEVIIRRDEVEEIIFAEPVGEPGARWRADLSSAVGEEIELVFRVRGGAGQDDTVEWVRPQIYGDVDVRTNVLLIVIDTLRADHLGSYGGEARTPNIDALARSGVRFENAYSHILITLPSHSSMLTSLLPTEHGAHNNGQVLSDEHLTLTELLRDTRRHTATFVSLGVLSAGFGVSQGFNEYHDTFGLNWWKTAEDVNADVLPWLEQRQAEPFFLFAHYSDPHEPYGAPHDGYPSIRATVGGRTASTFKADGGMVAFPLDVPPGRSEITLVPDGEDTEWPVRLNQLRTSHAVVTAACVEGCTERHPSPDVTEYQTELPATIAVTNTGDAPVSVDVSMRVSEKTSMRVLRERYREEVEYVDGEVGRLLSTLQSVTSSETLVILTSDHGEGLGEHGPAGHVTRLYEPQLRVPLIFSWPERLEAGVAIDQPVAHVDLLPTVVDLLNIPDSGYRSGRSLVPVMTGQPDPTGADVAIVSETFRPEAREDRKAIVAAGHKLISTPSDAQEELYDLQLDPGERRDLAQDRRDVTTRLRRLLYERMVKAGDLGTVPAESDLTQEQIERLRSLGYLR